MKINIQKHGKRCVKLILLNEIIDVMGFDPNRKVEITVNGMRSFTVTQPDYTNEIEFPGAVKIHTGNFKSF